MTTVTTINNHLKRLTPKQKRLVDQVLANESIADAGLAAGYFDKSNAWRAFHHPSRKLVKILRKANAWRAFHHPWVQEYYKQEAEKLGKKIREQCFVKINTHEYGLLKDHFESDDALREWASVVLMREALKDGLKLSGKLRKTIGQNTRYSVLHNAGFKCQACGAKPNKDNDVELQIDHVVPVILGGGNEVSNLQVLCSACNSSKHKNFAVNHKEELGDFHA